MSPYVQWLLVFIAVLSVACLLWPDAGWLARWRKRVRFQRKMRREDVLKYLLKQEAEGGPATVEGMSGAMGLKPGDVVAAIESCVGKGLVVFGSAGPELTGDGRAIALRVVRAHRLWESHLAENTGVDKTRWHADAELKEHELSDEEVARLDADLGHPLSDPDGDPIPQDVGDLYAVGGEPLCGLPDGMAFRVVHVEDEPAVLYARITKLGLHAGTHGWLDGRDTADGSLSLWAEGGMRRLPAIDAASVSVARLPAMVRADILSETHLSTLVPGECARVVSIDTACRGAQRRRLLDLGFVPGVRIGVAFASPSGGTVAYRVRQALVALREDQSCLIHVVREPDASCTGEGRGSE